MRILIFAGGYPPEIGGVQVTAEHVARGLQQRGHQVLVATEKAGVWQRNYTYRNVPVRRISFALPRRKARLLFFARALINVIYLLLTFRPTVVYVHFVSSYAPYLAVLRKLLRRKRLIVSLHGSDINLFPRESLLMHWSLLRLLAAAQAVVVNSASLLHDAKPYLPENGPTYRVIPNGIDPNVFRLIPAPPRHHRPYIFAAGRFVRIKGFPILLQAMKRVTMRYPQLDLIIAGAGSEDTALRQLTRDLALTDCVRFLGALPNEEIIQWMFGCELFVLPSLVEAMGIVSLEAMACGKAVVASNVGGVPEIVVDGVTGLLVPPSDPQALASAIIELLDNPDQRARMGEQGRKRVLTSYTWDQAVMTLLEIMR